MPTAGSVSQFTANGKSPAYSTAAFPTGTAGTSGNVLTSDGTNWISSAPATSGTVTSVSGTANQVAVATGTTTPVISLIGPYTPATYTAHGVLIGEGTSSIAATATGSAGQILQSGGAAANPAYSTATYPATAGSAGNVLTSDGTNWNSTAPAAPAFTPNTNVQLKDDFTGVNVDTVIFSGDSFGTLFSDLTWLISGASTTAFISSGITTPSTNPGIIGNVSTASSNACVISLVNTDGSGSFALGGGAITVNFIVKLATLSNGTNTYSSSFGMGDTGQPIAVQVNGLGFQYRSNVNSGNWQLITSKASARTTTSTSTAADTNWHNFQISINAAGTSAQFFIDGVSQGTIATNMPTAAIAPMICLNQTAGTIATNSMLVDLFYLNQTLTTPR